MDHRIGSTLCFPVEAGELNCIYEPTFPMGPAVTDLPPISLSVGDIRNVTQTPRANGPWLIYRGKVKPIISSTHLRILQSFATNASSICLNTSDGCCFLEVGAVELEYFRSTTRIIKGSEPLVQ